MKKNRVFSLLLCAALTVALLPTAALAEGVPISLSVQNGNIEISTAGTYVISGDTDLNTIEVDENVGSEDNPVNITLNSVTIDLPYTGGCAFSIGEGSYVNLTLRGDNTLTSGSSYAGLCVPDGATLNISEDSATAGTDSLSATSGNMNNGGYGAGIGGNEGTYNGSGGDCGMVTVSSGKVTANGSSDGAGIGGGAGGTGGGKGGTVTISGGTVIATGSNGAGIGGGNCLYCVDDTYGGGGGVVTISGGSVTAASTGFGAGIGGGGGKGFILDSISGGGGGTVTISGGTVTATGGSGGAGIGGGGSFTACGGSGGTVTISGGSVVAAGGGGIGGVGVGGAGIGGGYGRAGGSATISGGTVTATGGGGGAGIGGGFSGDGGTATIRGGTITATGGVDSYDNVSLEGAGIGGGYGGDGGIVYISGGSVYTIAGSSAQAIGKGQNGSDSGTLQNNGTDSQNVSLTTVTLSGITEGTTVSSLKAVIGGTDYSYGVKDMQTDSDGKLYLYLPEGACNLQIKAGAYSYAAALTVGGTGTNAVTANDLNSTSVDIDTSGTYVLTGSTNVNQIAVNGGTETEPVNIVLDNINIVNGIDFGSGEDNIHPTIDLHSGSFVNLTLQGTNMLLAQGNAALHVPEDAAVTIGGGGSLTVTADRGGAAIGSYGSYDSSDNFIPENSGSITINGGTVTAIVSHSSRPAAIGSGVEGNCGNITINGGTVNATANAMGAAIGSGAFGIGGNITINGGTVNATAGSFGAAIGGGASSDGGTVTITGGTVNANTRDNSGAAIGGGCSGSGGTVTITGGTVTASGYSGAGIGGGVDGDGGSAYISGGTVYASSTYGEAIGHGASDDGKSLSSGTLQNDSTDQTPVCLTAVTLQNAAGEAVGNMPVSSLAVSLNGSAYAYGTKNMQTDADGKLYLYLPADAVITAAQAAGYRYVGSVTAASDSAVSQGTLTLSSITGVTPEETDAPVSGNLAITFLGEMDPSVTGTVSLNGGAALTGGAWSGGNTIYTVPYSGLSYSTAYTVAVSGFKDAAGNAMVPDSTNCFTTCATPNYSAGDNSVYYTIRSSAGTGGNISPGGNTTVKEGNDQIYTVTANDGYEIKDVLVDGTSVGAVDSYTFENVKKAHTIAVSFEEKQAVNPFIDVTDGDWFYDSVLSVYDEGLMNGTASDTFSPNSGMTRGMFVTVLYRLSGDTGSYTSSFADVPSGKWYENAVAWATQNGISGGVGNNRFAPDDGITREQLAVLLYNYAKYKGYDVSIGEDTNILSYKDALDISDYAYPALQWVCGAGIMNGDSGYLSPDGPASRAQVAAMLVRFVEDVAG